MDEKKARFGNWFIFEKYIHIQNEIYLSKQIEEILVNTVEMKVNDMEY